MVAALAVEVDPVDDDDDLEDEPFRIMFKDRMSCFFPSVSKTCVKSYCSVVGWLVAGVGPRNSSVEVVAVVVVVVVVIIIPLLK